MTIIKDDNRIYIEKLPSKYLLALKKKLSIDNPLYYKLMKKGNNKALYTVKKEFKYFELPSPDIISIPKGMRVPLRTFLDKHHLDFDWRIDTCKTERKEPIVSTIELRDYQKPFIKAMNDNDRGILHLSTGGGKSVIALDYIASQPLTATIIVPNKTLLYQFIKESEQFLNYTPGQIGDGKKEIKDITVATMQSLKSDDDVLEELAAKTGVLIVDECHTQITEKSEVVLDRFRPHKFFGMTATPYRSNDDGRSKAIEFIFGPIIHSHRLEAMLPEVHVYCTGRPYPVEEYHDMVKRMVEDDTRNNLITGMAVAEIMTGKKVLILTKRIAHAQKFYDKMQHIPGVYFITKEMKDRAQVLRDMKDGGHGFTCIIGTFSLLGTGFDMPVLDRLFFAGDVKSNVLTAQSAGRILRILKGKDPIIYDMCDERNAVFKNQFKHRRTVYRKNEWPIVYHPFYMEKWL